jgi:hypothetical protein
MADIIDTANKFAADDLERAIAAARGEIKPGKPGECDLCGEWSSRLIEGECAPCRDRYAHRYK